MEQTRIATECLDDPGRRPLRVLLATPWGTACGIAEHSRMLKHAIEAADPLIEVLPCPGAVDPHTNDVWGYGTCGDVDVVHLNYQAALHSRWTPEQVGHAAAVWPVVVTYHDTGVPNSPQCRAIAAAADAMVVHEPFDDLPAATTYYWRMGVAAPAFPFLQPSKRRLRPILGTAGFPFPWKCYRQLAEVTAAAGWGLWIGATGCPQEERLALQAINPHTVVEDRFLPQGVLQGMLAGCDATAFCYVTHNTGQSGAILQGIAARKPLLALWTCRQMRALYRDPLAQQMIHWCETFEEVQATLGHVRLSDRPDPGMVALAAQESWGPRGHWYAALYRRVVAAREGRA